MHSTVEFQHKTYQVDYERAKRIQIENREAASRRRRPRPEPVHDSNSTETGSTDDDDATGPRRPSLGDIL